MKKAQQQAGLYFSLQLAAIGATGCRVAVIWQSTAEIPSNNKNHWNSAAKWENVFSGPNLAWIQVSISYRKQRFQLQGLFCLRVNEGNSVQLLRWTSQ